MSQHWHGHWLEDSFKPTKLKNWEIPKWYPSWPDRHCVTTKFEANESGHIISTKKKLLRSPWGNFKGTWDLPKRITRQTAEILTQTSKRQKIVWDVHKIYHNSNCQNYSASKEQIQGVESAQKKMVDNRDICETCNHVPENNNCEGATISARGKNLETNARVQHD